MNFKVHFLLKWVKNKLKSEQILQCSNNIQMLKYVIFVFVHSHFLFTSFMVQTSQIKVKTLY